MISEIFEFYYTSNMYPERLKPLTKQELCRGMSEDAADTYLSLVEQLYNAYSIDVNAKYVPKTPEERHRQAVECDRIYTALIKHLFKQDAISDDAFVELRKAIPIDFDFCERPDTKGKYVGDSLDDFRLAFEWALLDSDMNINLTDLYLTDRYGYGYCVRPETGPKQFVTAADLFLYRDADATQLPFEEITYWEAQHLLKCIQQDMEKNEDEQRSLDMTFCKPQGYQYNYIVSLQKTTYPKPKTIAEWYTIKRALELERGELWNIEDQVKRIVETMKKPEKTVGTGASLYIYKGKTSCHQQNHHLVPATAILHDEYDQEIELDVEYCPQCKRYMLNFVSFESYRERYGVLIGKLRMISSNGFGGEFDMALESPLKLCGYNVSQTEGLSSATRQYILSKIIHDGIMTKLDVIHYLEHFINMNGSKKENSVAAEKWHEDLEFVHKYDMSIQPRVYISSIKKY